MPLLAAAMRLLLLRSRSTAAASASPLTDPMPWFAFPYCSLSKRWGDDWWCDSTAAPKLGYTPAAMAATADPIADGTGTSSVSGASADAGDEPADDGPAAQACEGADNTCVGVAAYCLGKLVTPCPPGFACNSTAGAASVCSPAVDAATAAELDAATNEPECEGLNTCIDDFTWCFNSTTIQTCADGARRRVAWPAALH